MELNGANFKKEVLESPIPVLVEFGADWCGPCHMIAPILKELSNELKSQVKVFQIDIDSNGSLAQKYGIQKIPALLFFNNGEVVDQTVGVQSKETIKEKLNQLFSI